MTEAKSTQPQLPPLKDNRDWQWDSGGPYDGALKIVLSQLAERERQLLTALAENESLKAERDVHRSDLYESRGVVTGENFAWMQQRAEKAESERDQALEVIRGYRFSSISHRLCSTDFGCCSTCIKADALLSRREK